MSDLSVRAARLSDIGGIEALVRAMFRDLGTTVVPPEWSASLRDAFVAGLGHDLGAFVTVDDGGEVIAVAVGVVDRRLPSPRRPTGRIGYVEWLATDARHRRRGAARMAMGELLRWFDGWGITTVDVHASADARSLYQDLGFGPPSATALRRSTGATTADPLSPFHPPW